MTSNGPEQILDGFKTLDFIEVVVGPTACLGSLAASAKIGAGKGSASH